MARRYFRKLAALAKVETTYGIDAVPTGAANAMLVTDVTVTPFQGEQVSRNLMLPYFGDQGMVLAGLYARMEGSIEFAGSGAAGTVPAFGPLLRACGLAEIVTATTKVEYKPASGGQESVSLYANLDGVNHIMVGARGTVSLSVAPKQIPKLRFTLSGLLGPIADTPLPAAVYTGFQKPLVCSKANTAFAIHGLAAAMESFSFDLGNTVEARMLVNAEGIEITDRKSSGSTVIEAVPLATKDWFAISRASTTGPLLLTHGTAAGNIAELQAPAVQIGLPSHGNSQGILTHTLPLMFDLVSGDDEAVLRFR